MSVDVVLSRFFFYETYSSPLMYSSASESLKSCDCSSKNQCMYVMSSCTQKYKKLVKQSENETSHQEMLVSLKGKKRR